MKGILILGTLGVLAMVGFFVFSSSKPETESKTITTPTQVEEDGTKTVETKAAFAIFTNGTFRVFTASMYHNQSNDVFIESLNPNIVRIKKAGITWDDFFKTLPMKLTRDCLTAGTGQTFCADKNQTLKFYLNGTKDPAALEKIIKNGDQLLVSFGAETEDIQKQIGQIQEVN